MVNSESKTLQAITEQFKLNTRLFNNLIEDITEEQCNLRLKESTNSIKWICGHLLNSRYGISSLIGMSEQDPYEDLFGHGKGMLAESTYPSIVELRNFWNEFSPKLIRKIELMQESELDKTAPFKLPIDDGTMLGALSFFAHHETYHLGQLGFIRKYLGFDPMKYT